MAIIIFVIIALLAMVFPTWAIIRILFIRTPNLQPWIIGCIAVVVPLGAILTVQYYFLRLFEAARKTDQNWDIEGAVNGLGAGFIVLWLGAILSILTAIVMLRCK